MKTIGIVSTIIGIFLIIYLVPWPYSNRSPSQEELKIIAIMANRKEFADQVIREYSGSPKEDTKEVRALYKDAQTKFNTIIELFGYGTDNRAIPIDTLSNKLPEAEIAYNKLHDYIMPIEQKQYTDQRRIAPALPPPSYKAFDYLKGEQSLFAKGESGELARAFSEIIGKKEIYEKIAKRIERYRWNPFPEK